MSGKSPEKDSKKNEDLKKEVIRNFVLKNHLSEGDSEEVLQERVKYFLQKSLGPDKKGQVAVFDQGEFLMITRKGNIIGPS